MSDPQPTLFSRIRAQGDFLLAGAVFALLFIMLVPLPPVLMDMLLASSISLALLLFLASIFANKPVEFTVFPSMLLVATVFRLALNVATTRLILLDGSEGSHSAGKVIESFGQFVVGGNYVVGVVVFVILVVINFVVITKGAGRVAEVAARFTLDALPGKQMAIDAELNAGLIDEVIARERRAEVGREADFYGAMDGASKFIRGDAIAGVIITLINVAGGVFIGTVQAGMPLSEALQTYVLLTIGDGLAGQVPALVVSTAAGLLVTRVSDISGRSLHAQVGDQLLQNPRVLALSAGTIGLFALIPGLHLPFAVMAVAVGGLAWQTHRHAEALQQDVPAAPDEPQQAAPEELLGLMPLTVEVAADLLYLLHSGQGGELGQRFQKIREQFAQDLGLVLPSLVLRDNLELSHGTYRVLLRGEEIGKGRVQPRHQMALDPGTATSELRSAATTDPVFGLPAYWITDDVVQRAQGLGYTVVDVPTVVTTHLVELLHAHGFELFDAVQLDRALDRVSVLSPRLVDDLVPDRLSRQTVLRVFRNLVKEGLSVRDAQTILSCLAEYAATTQEPDVLTEFVRRRLSRHITRRYADDDGAVHVVSLAPDAEDALLRGLQTREGAAPSLRLEPSTARHLILTIRDLVESYPGPGQAVVLCPPLARGALRRLIERVLPRIPVLSSAELLASVRLEQIGIVNLDKGLKAQ